MRVLKFYSVICFSWQLDIDFDDMNPWHVYFLVLNEQFCSCFTTQMSAFCFVVTHVCCKWILDFYCEELIFIVKNWFIFSSLMIFLLQSLDPCLYVFSLGITLQVFETRRTTTKSNNTIGIASWIFETRKTTTQTLKCRLIIINM